MAKNIGKGNRNNYFARNNKYYWGFGNGITWARFKNNKEMFYYFGRVKPAVTTSNALPDTHDMAAIIAEHTTQHTNPRTKQ